MTPKKNSKAGKLPASPTKETTHIPNGVTEKIEVSYRRIADLAS
jgi:hypothetical protein